METDGGKRVRITKWIVAAGVIVTFAVNCIRWGLGAPFTWPGSLIGTVIGAAIGQVIVFGGVALLNRRRRA